jgi:hypothetical protein
VAVGGRPERLHAEPAEGIGYVIYTAPSGAGILAVDGRTLAVVRDSGPVLPRETADLAVSPVDQVAFAAVPSADIVLVLDATTFAAVRPPLSTGPGSSPVRVRIAERLGILLVGLDGGSKLAAYDLPSLAPARGFPSEAVARIHTIAVDEDRLRAWVGGSLRYAVVDLLNPRHTTTFEMPTLPSCMPPCATRLWSLVLSPVHGRAYLLGRRDGIASVVATELDLVAELTGRLGGYMADLVQNPRTGDLLAIESGSAGASAAVVDPWTLREKRDVRVPVVGDGPVDAEVLP